MLNNKYVSNFVVYLICVLTYILSSSPSNGQATTLPDQTGLNGLLSTHIDSPQSPATWQRSVVDVAKCSKTPKIDGVLDDDCWKHAKHIAGFYRYIGNSPVIEQTEVWLCSDSTHLYFAFHCMDDHPELIHASETQRNGAVTLDDYIEIVMDSHDTQRNSSIFYVTARGTQSVSLEGGTATNISWAGDWRAATRRVSDGWTAEIAIPFGLMRYAKGSHEFGIGLARKLARETSLETWPYLPEQAQSNFNQYLAGFGNLNPTYYASHPTYLPYVLVRAGDGAAVRQGIDVKYPFTTTLTGVATFHPDLSTTEQNVASNDFSYTTKFVADQRPFFAEGSGYFPSTLLLNTTNIASVDEGVKLVGKQGNTTIGILGTNSEGSNGQGATAVSFAQDIGLLSEVGGQFVSDNQKGIPNNKVDRFFGTYGVKSGANQILFSGDYSTSWIAGFRDHELAYNVSTQTQNGKPSFSAGYNEIGPLYYSLLGYVPERNFKGATIGASQSNQFDSGALETYKVNISASTFNHYTGGFFHKATSISGTAGFRNGVDLTCSEAISQRNNFHDDVTTLTATWGNKTVNQLGGISESFGHQVGQEYNFLTVGANVLVTSKITFQATYNRLDLGSLTSNQTILTGSYLLSDERNIGGRIVSQDGNTNVFLSYGQQVRSGSDIYLLLGAPNSSRTQETVTVKVVHPI